MPGNGDLGHLEGDTAAMADDLGADFLRTLATPEPIKDWSLSSLKEKLIKIAPLPSLIHCSHVPRLCG
jgi:hypothetical protein